MMILSLGGIIIWYSIKNILADNGYKTSQFRGHFNDFFNMSDLIFKTDDPAKKKNYKLLLWSLVFIVIAFIGTALTFIGDPQKMQCRYYNDYIVKEIEGTVTNKYMDAPNHNFPTLTIKTGSEEIKDIDLSHYNHGFYDSVSVGDKIRKLKGDSLAYLTTNGRTIEFSIRKKDFCED